MLYTLSKFDTSLSCSRPFFTNSFIKFSSSSDTGTSVELNNCNPTPSPISKESAASDDHVPPPPCQSDRKASTGPNWQQAMTEELCALEKINTWDLVDLPTSKTPIGCKWVYKIKTHSDASVERCKVCLVAKGYTHKYGIDYEETFALVARLTSVQSLLAVAAIKKSILFQMDVKNVFFSMEILRNKSICTLLLDMHTLQIKFAFYDEPCMDLNKLLVFGL
ncbi:hypothetical protein Scep_002269 [Stephania cephalantha]|uniref:Reverse transcriptase Ty1/copia-type domain-containing protein n=1 Tax=Stephania cephalantha TaxID=152367 RepID=A0AAP0Q4T6_9MAGN